MPILGHLGCEGQTFPLGSKVCSRSANDSLQNPNRHHIGSSILATGNDSMAFPSCACAFAVQKTKTTTQHLSQWKENLALSSLLQKEELHMQMQSLGGGTIWVGQAGLHTHTHTHKMKTQNKEIAHKIVIKEITSSMSWDFSIQMIAVDWGLFLGWEDLLEKEMAIHSSTLAWKIP